MTIFKPGKTGEENKKSTQKQEQSSVSADWDEDDDFPVVTSEEVDFIGIQKTPMRRHHVTIFKCFGLCGILILTTLLIAGSAFFYLHHKSPKNANTPWTEMCRVRYHEWKKGPHGKDDMFLMEGEYHQQIELDIVGERYEKLYMPSVLNARHAIVLHDMEMGLTAVIDQDNSRCFVKKINSTLVKPIGDFYDLVQYNKAGYYLPDAELTYENYAVSMPRIDNVSQFGQKIFGECRYFDTYRLSREERPQTVDDSIIDQKSSCPYKGERYCTGNSGSKYMLIFTLTGCVG